MDDLSPAELRVLRLAAEGLTGPQTARALGRGWETIKTQRRSVLLKLEAKSMGHAIALALRRGIIT